MALLTRTCREAAAILVAREDRTLALPDRVALRIHLTFCDACPRFERQILGMRNCMASWRSDTDTDEDLAHPPGGQSSSGASECWSHVTPLARSLSPTQAKLLRLWNRYQRLILVFLLLAALLALVELTGLRQNFTLETLRQQLADNRWRGLGIFVLLFVLGNLVQVPGWIFLASAVLVLGKLSGGMVTYIAASLSCAVTFLAVRWIGGDAVRQLDNKLASRLLRQLHAHPLRNMLILRALFQTLPALNYALAMSGIGFRKYLLATLLGLPLPIALYCLFFDYLARMLNLA